MINENSTFGGFLTDIGEAKQANANALEIPWKLTHMLLGDANGTDPVPEHDQTQLINQVHRAAINQLSVDPDNPAILIAEIVLPPNVGGWWIRELGLEDEDGDFVAVANCPPSYKPLLAQGSGRNQVVRMHLVLSNTANVQLKIDPSVVLATRKYVDDQRQAHEESRNHPGATESAQGMIQRATSDQALAGSDNTRAMTPSRVHQAFGKYGLGVGKSVGQIDLNEFVDSGFYLVPGSSQNVPVASDGALVVSGIPSRPLQIYTALSSARMFFRTLTANNNFGSWSTWRELVQVSRTISAGVGLSGGGDLSDNRTIRLGTPGELSGSTGNEATEETHTHALKMATKAEAEAGEDGSSLMSSLRTYQAILAAFPNSLGSIGYQGLAGGLILQWGIVEIPQDNSGVIVSLPVAMPNMVLNAMAVRASNTGPNSNDVMSTGNYTSTSFSVRRVSGSTALTYRWFALGN